jgi:hypothetical protein
MKEQSKEQSKETIPQLLIEYRSIVNRVLTFMTNQAYANGNKFSYKYDFTKGTGIITIDGTNTIKDYYTLTLYMNDNTTSKVYTKKIELLQQHYPTTGESKHKLEQIALMDLFTNSFVSLINTTYHLHLYKEQEDKTLIEDVTEEDIKKDDIILGANSKKEVIVPKLIIK